MSSKSQRKYVIVIYSAQSEGITVMEKTLSELIREYKDGGKRNFEKIAEKMNPLIEFYARKLYTWDREDARQEMLLALFLSLKKMKYCRNEGEMLSYLKTGIRRRYKDLMLKELHNKEETVYAEWTEVQDERDDFAISEFYMNLESALESFHGKERKIAERILFYGESDTEAAIQEAVSRQYCNRIRKKFVRKM